jgi:hypothetical protein
MKSSRTHKSKDQPLLISVAESIGSTLGAIAAKADAAAGAAKEALSGSPAATSVKRKSKKIVRKGQRATANLKRTKPVRAARRTLRKATKRVAGRRARAKK